MRNVWDWDNSWDAIDAYIKEDIKMTHQSLNLGHSPIYNKSTPKIKRVIFNNPATIILWTDGPKSVVQCQNGEPFDPEKGFALAYLKKLLGNKNEFNKEIHKWVKYDD